MTRLHKFAVASAGAIAVVLAGGILAWQALPSQVAAGLMWANIVAAGLENRTVATSFGRIHYLKGGEGPPMVFLHGIYARKEHWIDLASELASKRTVYLIDLPGFGENAPLDEGEYTYAAQVDHLTEVLDALQLSNADIVANSMGAQIAGMLAVDRPDIVHSLALVGGPAGVTSPVPSDMEKAMDSGEAPLVVRRAGDFDRRQAWLFPEVPSIPAPIMRTWDEEETARATLNRRIWREVRSSDSIPLERLAPRITQPTMIVWCRQDRVFHWSGAKVLAQELAVVRTVQPEACGHLPMLDAAKETAEELSDFYATLASRNAS